MRSESRSMNRPPPLKALRRDEAARPPDAHAVDVLALDAALDKLAALDPQQAKIVELRYFGGLTVEETAEALDISPATVKRHWTIARAWLKKNCAGERPSRRAAKRARRSMARVGALFDRALAAPPADRAGAWCAPRPEPRDVQDEVLALLASHDDSHGFLEPPALLEPGAEVGWYRIERIVGRGGMGVVYRAHDTRLHRAVALKALPPHLFRDDRMRARLRQEARAAAALSHPVDRHRVRARGDRRADLHRLGVPGGPRRCARSWRPAPCRGRARSTSRARSPRRSRPRTIAASCIAISSPRTSSSPPTASRFSTSASRSSTSRPQDLASATRLTDPGVIAGTPPYMAPEQLLGQPTSAQTDQFAFGVVLYEMLTGRHPFGSGDTADDDREGVVRRPGSRRRP